MENYRNPQLHYRQLRSFVPPEPLNLIEGYQKLSNVEIMQIAEGLKNYDVSSTKPGVKLTPNTPDTGILPTDDYAAQRWIAIKKKQIIRTLLNNQAAFDAYAAKLGVLADGSYNIRQSGNLTRVAAYLYSKSDFKQAVLKNSIVKKEIRRQYYEEHPKLQANLKALHYAERPIRNEIYELEQIDREEFPEAKYYLKGHRINHRLPTIQTMEKIAKQNAIPVFPEDARAPDYIMRYASQQENPPVLPDDFKFQYVVSRKGKKQLSRSLVERMYENGINSNIITNYKRAYANAQTDDQRRAISDEIRDLLKNIKSGATTAALQNQQHRYAQLQYEYI